MKEKYIDLMEKSLSAYTDEHILRYFDEVKEKGLTEHGFPRLTVNIGILISKGRRRDLYPIFLEMMEFCCYNIPRVKAANDFSVREIICCIIEIEESGVVDKKTIDRWKSYIASFEPCECYNIFANQLDDKVNNWALFSGVSEFFRAKALGCDTLDFIELQLGNQLERFDENGMYMDRLSGSDHQPIMYDIVPRGLLCLLLHFGYRGRYYHRIDDILKKSALLTLNMQSSNGEMAFGGRSNQFIHNEPWMIAIYEYEAARYIKEGNTELASNFKSAIARALRISEEWLSKEPIRHIKNYFPTETQYGCENYAYFDKYMITVASNLYGAYMMCDESLPTTYQADHSPSVFETTEHFHKIFAKSGGYSLEFDTNADNKYDASGLGRVHRDGAPSAICLSLPCPSAPKYTIDVEDALDFSLCPAVKQNEAWIFGATSETKYELSKLEKTNDAAFADFNCIFENGKEIILKHRVGNSGVEVEVHGDGEIGYALPAFCFDGKHETDICVDENSITVSYMGWSCRYITDGKIKDLGKLAVNRNGHYKAFVVTAQNNISVKIEIYKI